MQICKKSLQALQATIGGVGRPDAKGRDLFPLTLFGLCPLHYMRDFGVLPSAPSIKTWDPNG